MFDRKHTLFASALVASLTLLAAACGGGSGSANASSPRATTETQSPATVAVAGSDLGKVLVDSHGRTLYLFGADMGTKSACAGECAQDWPPLLASGTATVGNGAQPSLVGTSTRSDGTQQVVYNGHPLYRFSGDHKAGDTNGQGITEFGGKWTAVTPTGNTATGTASGGSGSRY